MQTAVIEWARNQAGLTEATSAELNENTPHPVIHLLPEQQDVVDLGGTMRLGVYPCRIAPGTLAQRLYGMRWSTSATATATNSTTPIAIFSWNPDMW